MSKKDLILGYIVIGSILTITGLVMTFFSINFGTSVADSWLVERGGGDTDYYHMIVTSYIQSFLVAGGILFGIGLVIVAIFYYKLQLVNQMKEKE